MEESGYLLIVLHTHMPFVREPEQEYSLEENWLFECITESYLPLIASFEKLITDQIDYRITLGLTPTLLAMLRDTSLQQKYIKYLENRSRLAEEEIKRLGSTPRLLDLSKMYYDHFKKCLKIFTARWDCDLSAAFGFLQDSGKVEILASSATHAYLPLWEHRPSIIDLQIRLGIHEYKKVFRKNPSGFWLPECGFIPGVVDLLYRNGIRYSFLDAHGIYNGNPRPKYGVYAPVISPPGVAFFGRDWQSHDLVWLKDKGYPGDPYYLNCLDDIGYDLPVEYTAKYTHFAGPVQTGIKYFSVGQAGSREVYDPDVAFWRCDAHANDFVLKCKRMVEQIYSHQGRKPVLVALFDTEHFGHWWREGPLWLDLVIRKIASDQKTVKLVTAGEYLNMYPYNQVILPSTSSWGYQGYHETWLMGRTHWIYPEIYEAIDLIKATAPIDIPRNIEFNTLFNQYLRELLLAQSSDWAFMMHSQNCMDYAERRVREHLNNIAKIWQQLYLGKTDIEWNMHIQCKNNIFSDTDLWGMYTSILSSHQDYINI